MRAAAGLNGCVLWGHEGEGAHMAAWREALLACARVAFLLGRHARRMKYGNVHRHMHKATRIADIRTLVMPRNVSRSVMTRTISMRKGRQRRG